jgi:hypothetical protein
MREAMTGDGDGRIDVIHVGSACRDLTADDPRGWRLGGVDEAGAGSDELGLLRDAGVELRLARLAEAPIFENRESPAGRVQTSHAVGLPLPVQALPARWREARAWSLVPVAGEVSDAWVEVIPAAAYVAVGWQGMLRDLAAGRRVRRTVPGPSIIVRRADLIGVSHHDVDAGTSLSALAALLHPGAELLVTEGGQGGLLVRVGEDGVHETLRYLPTGTDGEADPTGAGDTFLAALLASVLQPDIGGPAHPGRPAGLPDLRFAAAAGSLAVEAPGLTGVPDLAAVLARQARDPIRPAVVPSTETTVGAPVEAATEPA